MFPIYNEELRLDVAGITILLGDMSFYNAVWLFSAMLFETALDIERLLVEEKDM